MSTTHHELANLSLIGDRQVNQDRCVAVTRDSTLLLVLADGMGGHPTGEVAARILVDTCRRFFKQTPLPILSPGSFLKQLLHKAHEGIVSYGFAQEPAIEPRTTAVVALIQNGFAYWAHTGDSRLYLFRNGELLTRTRDHSYVERLLEMGVITESELENHPQKNYVTRCLGGTISLPEIPLQKHEIRNEDIIALCSDGVWGNLKGPLMTQKLFSGLSLDHAVQAITQDAALSGFPEADNATLIATRIGGLTETAKALEPRSPPDSGTEEKLDEAIASPQDAINHFEDELKQVKK